MKTSLRGSPNLDTQIVEDDKRIDTPIEVKNVAYDLTSELIIVGLLAQAVEYHDFVGYEQCN